MQYPRLSRVLSSKPDAARVVSRKETTEAERARAGGAPLVDLHIVPPLLQLRLLRLRVGAQVCERAARSSAWVRLAEVGAGRCGVQRGGGGTCRRRARAAEATALCGHWPAAGRRTKGGCGQVDSLLIHRRLLAFAFPFLGARAHHHAQRGGAACRTTARCGCGAVTQQAWRGSASYGGGVEDAWSRAAAELPVSRGAQEDSPERCPALAEDDAIFTDENRNACSAQVLGRLSIQGRHR